MKPTPGRILSLLALLMMAAGPSTAVFAEQAKTSSPQSTVINDVATTPSGALQGTAIGKDAKPMAEAMVKLTRNGTVVAEEVTTSKGTFQISHVKPGLYVVQVGELASALRVWDHKIAPPKAKSELLLIEDSPVVRGQLGNLTLFNTVMLGTSIAGLTVGIVNADKIDDLDNKVDAIPTSP